MGESRAGLLNVLVERCYEFWCQTESLAAQQSLCWFLEEFASLCLFGPLREHRKDDRNLSALAELTDAARGNAQFVPSRTFV